MMHLFVIGSNSSNVVVRQHRWFRAYISRLRNVMIRSLGVNSIEKELNRFRGLRMITIIIQ